MKKRIFSWLLIIVMIVVSNNSVCAEPDTKNLQNKYDINSFTGKRKFVAKFVESIDLNPADSEQVFVKKGQEFEIQFKIKQTSEEKTVWPDKYKIPLVFTVKRLDSGGHINFIPEKYLFRSLPDGDIYSQHFNNKGSKVLDSNSNDKIFFKGSSDIFVPGHYRLFLKISNESWDSPNIIKETYKDFTVLPYPYKEDNMSGYKGGVRYHIYNQVVQAFYDNDFSFLEELAANFNKNKLRSPSGLWKRDMLCGGIRGMVDINVKNEEYWRTFKSKAQKWIELFPNSSTAYIAQGIILQEYAWKFRGPTYAYKVPEEAWEPFRKNLQIAREFLESNKHKIIDDPNYYSLMANIMIEQSTPSTTFDSFVDEGLKKEPLNYDLYFTAARNAQPKWGGSKEQIEQVANDAVKRTKNLEGMGLYARIYWSAYYDQEKNIFIDSDLKWENMRQGMLDIVKTYSVPWNINFFAYFSCMAGKKEDARYFINQIQEPEMEAWKSQERFLYYKQWAESK